MMRRTLLTAVMCVLVIGVAGKAEAATLTKVVQTTDTGGILLPGFDTSLGELIQASVTVAFSGTTGGNSSGDSVSHDHGFSFDVGPIALAGSTDVAFGMSGEFHAHTISGNAVRVFTDPVELGTYFEAGSDVWLAAPTNLFTLIAQGSGVAIHRHTIPGTSLSFTATTEFTYEPFATVPEPSTLALGGIACLAGLGYLRRYSRTEA